MRKTCSILMIALLLILLGSCERWENIDVPGLAEFEREIRNEYPYVRSIRCTLFNPTLFAVQCRLEKHIIPEKMTDLIEVLKEYALTDALDAYYELVGTEMLNAVSLEFNVQWRTVFFRYVYDLGGYDEPAWELVH
jgi:hypothetical protein